MSCLCSVICDATGAIRMEHVDLWEMEAQTWPRTWTCLAPSCFTAYLAHCTNQGHLSADPWTWLHIQACHTDTNTATVNPTTKPVLAFDSPAICAAVTHTQQAQCLKKIYIMFCMPILCNKPSHPPCGHLNFKILVHFIFKLGLIFFFFFLHMVVFSCLI